MLMVAERPRLSLVLTIISGVCNIVFDYLLIVVFKLGIIGAAIATLIGTIVSTVIPLIYFKRSKKSRIKFIKSKMKPNIIKKTCFNGVSEFISSISGGLLAAIFNYKLMQLAGNDGVSAYSVTMYASFVFISVFLGYSVGVSPIVSYNYGAKNYKEQKNIFRKSIVLIMSSSIVLFFLARLLARPFAQIFVGYDENLLNMTINGMNIFAISLLFMGINLFSSSFFTALNDGKVSGIISFVRTVIFQIGTVLIMSNIFGLEGIWNSIYIAEILAMCVNIMFLIGNRKKYGYG
jgi:Na+-driven multidrug efflux pump